MCVEGARGDDTAAGRTERVSPPSQVCRSRRTPGRSTRCAPSSRCSKVRCNPLPPANAAALPRPYLCRALQSSLKPPVCDHALCLSPARGMQIRSLVGESNATAHPRPSVNFVDAKTAKVLNDLKERLLSQAGSEVAGSEDPATTQPKQKTAAKLNPVWVPQLRAPMETTGTLRRSQNRDFTALSAIPSYEMNPPPQTSQHPARGPGAPPPAPGGPMESASGGELIFSKPRLHWDVGHFLL